MLRLLQNKQASKNEWEVYPKGSQYKTTETLMRAVGYQPVGHVPLGWNILSQGLLKTTENADIYIMFHESSNITVINKQEKISMVGGVTTV